MLENPDDKSIEVSGDNYTNDSSLPPSDTEIKSFSQAYEIFQCQYDNFTTNWSNLLMIITIVLAIITIVIPFFSYSFLQKETVNSFEKTN